MKRILKGAMAAVGILLMGHLVAWGGQSAPSSLSAAVAAVNSLVQAQITAQLGSYATSANLTAEIALARANETAIQNAIPLSDYIGKYTVATLPSATTNDGKRVLVSDLGGGPGYLRATSGCWKRVSTTTAAIQNMAISTSVTVDGLVNSPIVNFTGNAFNSKANVTITNACSMPQLTVVVSAGVFSTLGSLGISVGAAPSVSVAGVGTSGTWTDFAIAPDGSSLTKIRGGSL